MRHLRHSPASLLAVVFLALPAHAADPAAQCQKGRIQMSGKYASCLAAADAAFAAKPDNDRRDAARAKCDAKMQGLWSRRTTQYGAAECGGIWDDTDVRSWLGSCNDSLVAGIRNSFDIRPSLECIERNNDGSITAWFGYDNREASAVDVPVGRSNGVTTAGLDAGQPTTFQAGVVSQAFDVRFRGQVTWTVGGRSVTADRHSPLCTVQPPASSTCEADLRAELLSLETATDLAIAQLRSGYDSALALARAGIAPAMAPLSTGTDTPVSTRSTRAVSSCGTVVDQAMTRLGQTLTIAQQNTTVFQNQMIALLQAVAAAAAVPAAATTTGTRSLLDATVPGSTISADGFGNLQEWAASVLSEYLREAAEAHADFAAGVLEVAAAHGTVLDGTTPALASLADPAGLPRSIVSDDIDVSSMSLANSAMQTLNIAAQNAVVAQSNLCATLLATLTQASSAVTAGKALYRGTLDQARDPDRFLLADPDIEQLDLPAAAAMDPAVEASAEAFFQLAQANNRGFHSALEMYATMHSGFAARILSLAQSVATPPTASLPPAAPRSAGHPRVVDPDADAGDVALANLIASFAQSTSIQMQNEALAQSSLFTTNRATLAAQVSDWLSMP